MPPRAKTTTEDTAKLVQNLTDTGGAPSAAVGTAVDDAGTEGQASSVTSEAVGPVSDDNSPVAVDADEAWLRAALMTGTAEAPAVNEGSVAPGEVTSGRLVWTDRFYDPRKDPAWLAPPDAHDRAFEFAAQFPRLTSLLAGAKAEGRMPTRIRVNSHVDGFRRAGQRHPFGVSEYPFDHFDPAQLEIMLGEPALTVELV